MQKLSVRRKKKTKNQSPAVAAVPRQRAQRTRTPSRQKKSKPLKSRGWRRLISVTTPRPPLTTLSLSQTQRRKVKPSRIRLMSRPKALKPKKYRLTRRSLRTARQLQTAKHLKQRLPQLPTQKKLKSQKSPQLRKMRLHRRCLTKTQTTANLSKPLAMTNLNKTMTSPKAVMRPSSMKASNLSPTKMIQKIFARFANHVQNVTKSRK